ncbi:hypothetical protein UFOVP435_10 [uncultured Caudovirales phage]|uniref:Uncharacterized protein n=1 Tax=uncultured Caudovirales phage TaxID=2100421 RepID=A0A6J5M7K4_9CAUD|nr:hypothetical protein UFOVP435_10 [uncultured Caudovirales phage]
MNLLRRFINWIIYGGYRHEYKAGWIYVEQSLLDGYTTCQIKVWVQQQTGLREAWLRGAHSAIAHYHPVAKSTPARCPEPGEQR